MCIIEWNRQRGKIRWVTYGNKLGIRESEWKEEESVRSSYDRSRSMHDHMNEVGGSVSQ